MLTMCKILSENNYYIFSTYADSMPLPSQLHRLKSNSGKVVKVNEHVCVCWEAMALQLHFSQGLTDIIKKNDEPEKALDDMMKRWLKGTEGTRQPITWRTLLAVFREIDHITLATDLENILPKVLLSEN